MVKKYIAIAFIALFAVGGILVGCNKTGALVTPANAAVLKLTIPASLFTAKPHASVKASAKGVHALDAVPDSTQGRLKYCITAPGEIPVKGTIDYASGSEVGTVSITLPKAGKWVVAAEWFYTFTPETAPSAVKAQATSSLVEVPEFAGADVADVEGSSSVTLAMEDFNYQNQGCYYPSLSDSGAYECTDSFNYAYSFYSGNVGESGDVEALYDSTSGSEYLTYGFGSDFPVSMFAYVGNGDLVNFATVPDNATYYASTLAAKAAIVGQANEAMAAGDVYVIKNVAAGESNNGKAWLQVSPLNLPNPTYCNPGEGVTGGSFNFWFILNAENYNYMFFDETECSFG